MIKLIEIYFLFVNHNVFLRFTSYSKGKINILLILEKLIIDTFAKLFYKTQ